MFIFSKNLHNFFLFHSFYGILIKLGINDIKQSKDVYCVMGVGMCLYAQRVQTKNKQCKSAIILQCYHPHLSDFCTRPRLTQPYNLIIYPGMCGQLATKLRSGF